MAWSRRIRQPKIDWHNKSIGPDLFCGGLQQFFVPRAQHNVHPILRQTERDGSPDAPIGAGHNGNFHFAWVSTLTGVPEISESGGLTISDSSGLSPARTSSVSLEVAANR